ncbi:MAG: hypothetical protein AAFO29_10695, partial [Actinomycetota bacterium]
MRQLRRLLIGDAPGAWAEAGFTIKADETGPWTTLGTVAVRFVESDDSGLIGWELADDNGMTGTGADVPADVD